MTESKIRVVIADDHPIFRNGLRRALESAADVAVVAEAGDGDECLTALAASRPDVVVLDLDMPKTDGFAVVRALRAEGARVRTVILTMHDNEDFFNEAMDLGVDGYVLKDGAVSDIVACVRAVVSGRNYVSPTLGTYLLARTRRATAARGRPELALLTATERRVLARVAAGRTSREIAAELFVSVRTVENHRANICAKLGLRGANALLRFALEHRADLASLEP